MTEAFMHPVSPEFHERELLGGLLRVLHEHEENALQLQRDQQEAHDRALQPLRAGNYVITFLNETEQIPAQHHRLIFGPQYHSPAYEGIARIIARYPFTATDQYPDHTAPSAEDANIRVPSTKPWNDVFLEVVHEEGRSQNYLLNSKGLVAFRSADDIGADMRFEQTDDLFEVIYPAEDPEVGVDIFTLDYLINYKPDKPDSYVYHPQTNEQDPPAYF